MSDDSEEREGKSLGFPGTPIAVPVGLLSAPSAAPETTARDPSDEGDGAPAGQAADVRARPSSEVVTRRVAHPALAKAIVDDGAALEARLGRATAGPIFGAIAGGSATFIGASIDAPALISVGLLALVAGVFLFLFNVATSDARRRQLRRRLSQEMAGGDGELVWAGFEAFRHARRPTYASPGPPPPSRQVDAVIAALGEHRREQDERRRGALRATERRARKQARKRKKKRHQQAVARRRQKARRR